MNMSTSGVKLDKIEKMAGMSFQNSIRLHCDSIILYNNCSYPSAYFLSILSLEELGKVFLLEDVLYHSRVEGRKGEEWEQMWLRRIFSHRDKQYKFTWNSQFNLPKSFLNTVFDGRLEIKKQNALYVGLNKGKGGIDLKSRISNPFKIGLEKAQKQITIVSDCLLELIMGKIKDQYILDSEVVEDMMDMSLYSKIRSNWKYTSQKVQKRIERLEKLEFHSQ